MNYRIGSSQTFGLPAQPSLSPAILLAIGSAFIFLTLMRYSLAGICRFQMVKMSWASDRFWPKRPPVLPRQPHINILHVIIRIDGFEEGFDFFTFGIVAEGDGIFGAVANHCGGDGEALCG